MTHLTRKKLISLVLTLTLLASTLIPSAAIFASAEPSQVASVPNGYVKNGLVAWYDGSYNTREGLNTDADKWEDLVSGYDLPVSKSATNYFTESGLHVQNGKHKFPNEIRDVVNANAFTVEILLSDFRSIGGDFNTFMNSTNDNFALFRRNSNDVLEFKFAAVAGSYRPTVADGLNLLQNALITVTYRVDGETVIYVNGIKAAAVSCSNMMGADDLFIGQVSNKDYETVYKSMRFYNRELSPKEVAHNAAVDGKYAVKDLYVSDGLVALYSGFYNTENGFDAQAAVWADLAGDNDISLNINEKNYFTREGFHLNSSHNFFPRAVLDTVNGEEFTVEMQLGALKSLGSSFNTFINSSNDNFSLFRRLSNDVLEFKYYANAIGSRPTIENGLDVFADSLITVTYRVGDAVRIYVDGELMTESACAKTMGADDLFFGHPDGSRNYDTTFRALRFYNRALTNDEVLANARADGAYVEAVIERDPDFVTIEQSKTRVAGDLALIYPIESSADFKAAVGSPVHPAYLLVTLDTDLNAVDANGKKIVSVMELFKKLDYKSMIVFNVGSKGVADRLIAYLNETGFYDCCVMSSDESLIAYVRGALPRVRGVIDYTQKYAGLDDLTIETCLEIRKSMHANMGTVALLPANCATKTAVQYLYDSIVNVWVRASDTPTERQTYEAVVSGAIGVVSKAVGDIYNAAVAFPENTVTRMPLNIAHRGLSSSYPENTLDAAIAAYEAGADVIECDIYLTRDNQIVIMHDPTTGRTCNRDLNIEGSTLAQLKELTVNKGYESKSQFDNCRIPTLEEYLAYFKGKDCRLFIEIKSSKKAIVSVMKDLIEQYGMYGQCSVITFLGDQLDNLNEIYPGMTGGALCSGVLDETGSDADMKAVMQTVGKYNATLNPSASGYGENAIRAALLRGIAVYPWTFDANSFKNYFTWGYSGLTGNNANALTKYAKTLTTDAGEPADGLKAGDSVKLKATLTAYNRSESDVSDSVEYLVIEGGDIVTVTGSTLTFAGEGTVTVVPYYTQTRQLKYTVVGEPVTLNVSAADPGTAIDTETDADTGAVDEPGSEPDITEEPESGADTVDEQTDVTTETPTDAATSQNDGTAEADGSGAAESATDPSEQTGGCGSSLIGIWLTFTALLGLTAVLNGKTKSRRS